MLTSVSTRYSISTARVERIPASSSIMSGCLTASASAGSICRVNSALASIAPLRVFSPTDRQRRRRGPCARCSRRLSRFSWTTVFCTLVRQRCSARMTERPFTGECCPPTERRQGPDRKTARCEADFAHQNRRLMCKTRIGILSTCNPVRSHQKALLYCRDNLMMLRGHLLFERGANYCR